ncbi:MAG TPA: DUF885 domain-containing protein [Novosphingobium sp.]|nr:DUF885 domain-containing protein [Novosphingobium sp.]
MPPVAVIRRLALAFAAFALTAPALAAAPAAIEAQRREEARLMQLFEADARAQDRLDPLSALYRGGEADPASLAQLFTDRLDRQRLGAAETALRAAQRIDRTRLGAERRLSLDAFLAAKREQVRWLQPDMRALTTVRPFNHFGGLHVEWPAMVGRDGALDYDTEADYRRALALSAAFAGVLDTATARFREGLESGVVEPRLTVANMIAQIDAILAQPIEVSPFYAPVLDFPASVPVAARAPLREAYADNLEQRVRPAYARLRAFLANEYLPAARAQPGLSAMKGGPFLYRQLIARQTTLALDPDEVHALGLAEVARILGEMEKVKAQLGYAGSLRAFFDHIRVDPRFHPSTAKELADGFAATGRAVDAQIPRFFRTVPRTPLVIQPYPAYREKFEAGGSYSQGSPDGSRPGTFYFNTYDLPSRFLSGIATLYLHEGAPGHHFQISLALENTSLPAFQRFDGNTAYVEGWALYAETLGFEMGLFDDPMQHWGTLDDEMLRAMRLVVDTGLHTRGWSRDHAIGYMLANSGMGRSDAEAEVDRYIANPAQALAYKIGALTIQRLRARAEAELGPRFDIRAFHEEVLGSGALPLPVLEAKIDGWIAASR